MKAFQSTIEKVKSEDKEIKEIAVNLKSQNEELMAHINQDNSMVFDDRRTSLMF